MNHLEYIISYGLSGDFGRFRAAAPLALPRGARAVIRGARGVEIGQVLRPATPRHAAYLPNTTVGQLLRPVGPEDETDAEQRILRGGALLARGAQLIETLQMPMTLLDAEVLLDNEHAVLHYLHWGQCDMREFVSTLSREFAMHVMLFMDLTAPAAEPESHGCGSCGSDGGCGSCGSGGGCGSCGATKADEGQARFAALREKMERRVPLL